MSRCGNSNGSWRAAKVGCGRLSKSWRNRLLGGDEVDDEVGDEVTTGCEDIQAGISNVGVGRSKVIDGMLVMGNWEVGAALTCAVLG
jgi:hypothetical protein